MELTCNVHQKEDIHCFEGHITSVVGLQHVYFVNLSHYFRVMVVLMSSRGSTGFHQIMHNGPDSIFYACLGFLV